MSRSYRPQRALFHIFAGLIIPVSALFLPKTLFFILLGIGSTLYLVVDLLRLRLRRLNGWFCWTFQKLLKGSETSRLTGASYMIIASIIAIAAFPLDLAILALSFLAAGDPLATLVGYYKGRHRLFGKSLEGSLTCLVACVGVGLIHYYTGLNVPLPVILVGAAVATIAEAMPLRIDDNLPMPLLAVTAMWLMTIW